MGEDRYERAVVAPTLIKYLIKTLYDDEYGRENGRYRESEEYFAHDQLEYVVDQLWRAGPPEPEEGLPHARVIHRCNDGSTASSSSIQTRLRP